MAHIEEDAICKEIVSEYACWARIKYNHKDWAQTIWHMDPLLDPTKQEDSSDTTTTKQESSNSIIQDPKQWLLSLKKYHKEFNTPNVMKFLTPDNSWKFMEETKYLGLLLVDLKDKAMLEKSKQMVDQVARSTEMHQLDIAFAFSDGASFADQFDLEEGDLPNLVLVHTSSAQWKVMHAKDDNLSYHIFLGRNPFTSSTLLDPTEKILDWLKELLVKELELLEEKNGKKLDNEAKDRVSQPRREKKVHVDKQWFEMRASIPAYEEVTFERSFQTCLDRLRVYFQFKENPQIDLSIATTTIHAGLIGKSGMFTLLDSHFSSESTLDLGHVEAFDALYVEIAQGMVDKDRRRWGRDAGYLTDALVQVLHAYEKGYVKEGVPSMEVDGRPDIDRRHASTLSVRQFIEDYAMKKKPVIIQGLDILEEEWTLDHIKEKCGGRVAEVMRMDVDGEFGVDSVLSCSFSLHPIIIH